MLEIDMKKNRWFKIAAAVFLVSFLYPLTTGAASIKAIDDQGNIYELSDDGTYKKLEEKRLSNEEAAGRMVAAIRTYRKMYDKSVTEKQAKCINKFMLRNSGAKFVKLHLSNKPWEEVVKWLQTLPVSDGLVENQMLIASGLTYIIGPMDTAGRKCGLK